MRLFPKEQSRARVAIYCIDKIFNALRTIKIYKNPNFTLEVFQQLEKIEKIVFDKHLSEMFPDLTVEVRLFTNSIIALHASTTNGNKSGVCEYIVHDKVKRQSLHGNPWHEFDTAEELKNHFMDLIIPIPVNMEFVQFDFTATFGDATTTYSCKF